MTMMFDDRRRRRRPTAAAAVKGLTHAGMQFVVTKGLSMNDPPATFTMPGTHATFTMIRLIAAGECAFVVGHCRGQLASHSARVACLLDLRFLTKCLHATFF